MKALMNSALAAVHLKRPADRVYRRLRMASRAVLRTDRRLVSRYLAETEEPRLHIGWAGHLLEDVMTTEERPWVSVVCVLVG